MNFSQALELLKAGKRIYRTGWNGKGMNICMQCQDEYSKMTLPYIFMLTAQRELVPWVASHSDIFGEDWEEEMKTEGGEPECKENQDK